MPDFNFKFSKTVRIVLIIIGVILLILNLFTVDTGEIFSRENLGAALRIIPNILIIVGMGISLRSTDPK